MMITTRTGDFCLVYAMFQKDQNLSLALDTFQENYRQLQLLENSVAELK